MYNGVYNKAVYWNDEIARLIDNKLHNRYTITIGKHAERRIKENNLPTYCYKASLYGEVVECEFIDGEVNKVVTRLPHRTLPYDICSVVLFKDNQEAFVKTIWLNSIEDKHYTIRKENYQNGR